MNKMLEFLYQLLNLKWTLATAFLGAIYLYCTWTYSFWSKLGIACPSNPVPLFGNVWPSISGQTHFMNVIFSLYRKLGDQRFGGIYAMRTPELLIKDPELIGKALF